ncbi:MAG: peptide deformylase [Alphaproteobacteria bacterium]
MNTTKKHPLPQYLVADVNGFRPHILTTPAKSLTFPLSVEDKNDIAILEAKYDEESNIAGLAAPQVGIAKKIIVFAANETPGLKKWRQDFTQSMPKSIWINPSYEGIEEQEKNEDYEGCFSVKDLTGLVTRYKKINYKAYDVEGNLLEGTAEGFLARIIQHETDHVHGKLFIDYIPVDKYIPIEEYHNMRKKAMELKEKTHVK